MTGTAPVFEPLTCDVLYEPVNHQFVDASVVEIQPFAPISEIDLPSHAALLKQVKALVRQCEQEEKCKEARRNTLIIALVSVFALILHTPMASGSGVPNTPNVPHPVCHGVRYSYLHECAPDVLCAAPVGAPLGTRFFAYDLPDGVVLFPDTGNVTVPASKHGSVSFRVFAESPDASGAPGYVQSVVVRHEEVLAQPESMLQVAAKAALTAIGGASGFAIYWLVTQND